MARQNLFDTSLFGAIFKRKMQILPLVVELSGEYTVDGDSPPLLHLDPGGAGRDVLMPAEGSSEGLVFIIVNTADAAETLTVKEDSDTTTIVSIGQGSAAICFCDGTTWRGYVMETDAAATIANLTVTTGATLETIFGEVQNLSGAGAVDITSLITLVTTTGADALTLADGSADGQFKVIVMVVDGGDGTLTPTSFGNGSTLTFADAGDAAILVWDDTGGNWWLIGSQGAPAVA